MKYNEFIADLKNLKHIYLLAGEEDFYIDRAREIILSKLFPNGEGRSEGLIKLDCDKKIDITEIIGAIETAPFFAEKNVVLVTNTTLFKGKKSDTDDKADKKDTKVERLIKSLSNMLDTNYVIFTTGATADKRKKIYKTVAKVGSILEADRLRHWQIDEWFNDKLLKIDKTIDADARRYFIDMISVLPEISLRFLNNELDKAALYTKSKRITKRDLMATMTELPEVSSFALTEAINAKNFSKAMYLLKMQLMESRKEPAIVALLVWHIRLLMRAKFFMQQGIKGKDLAKPLDLNPYIAQKTGDAAKKFSDKVLEDVFLMLADADYLFKIGRAGAEMLERIVMMLCQK